MLSSQIKFSASKQTADGRTDRHRQTDTGKTICPRSIDVGA